MSKPKSKKIGAIKRLGLGSLIIAITASMVVITETSVHTYAISDGTETKEINSFNNDCLDAIELAGYDTEMYVLTDEMVDENGTKRLTLKKKFGVDISIDGTEYTAYTIDSTVSEILEAEGITLNEYDKVTPSLNEQLTGESQIKITRVVKHVEEELVDISYETIKRTTPELLVGENRVAQQGVNGQAKHTVEITFEDDIETSREIISEEIIKQPQPRVLEAGTGGSVVSRGGEQLRYSKVIDVTATAYSVEGYSYKNTVTAIGTKCRVGAIAVDPKVIPLGSRVYVTSADGKAWIYGTAVCEDTGGKIKGNRIDLYFNTQKECINFGVQKAKIYILQ